MIPIASLTTAALLLALAAAVPPADPPAAPRIGAAEDGTVASADGVPIRYHAEGQGEPALVLVHCWGCDRHLWDGQVARFAPHHRVVTLDLAGHGESGRGRQDWTIAAFGQDVRAVVEKLGLERVVLVGHSMSGPVILEAARAMPDRVVALVPVDTLLDVDRKPATTAELDAFFAPLRADFPKAVRAFIRDDLFLPGAGPALVERVVATAARMPPEIGLATLGSSFRYDARPALAGIRVPIVAINSDRYPTNLEAARRAAPQYRALFVPGVGHYPMLEKPERFDQLLDQVLAELPAKR